LFRGVLRVRVAVVPLFPGKGWVSHLQAFVVVKMMVSYWLECVAVKMLVSHLLACVVV
jgi:hypothetical protein